MRPPGPAGHIPNSRSIDHSHPQHSVVGGTRSAGSDATSTCPPRVGELVHCPPGRHTPGPGSSGQGQGGKSAGPDGHGDLGSLSAENMELDYQLGPLKERVSASETQDFWVSGEKYSRPLTVSLPENNQSLFAPRYMSTQVFPTTVTHLPFTHGLLGTRHPVRYFTDTVFSYPHISPLEVWLSCPFHR